MANGAHWSTPSYHPSEHSSKPKAYWDPRRDSHYNIPLSHTSHYYDTPQYKPSNTLPIHAPRPTERSKHRWPPSPIVEDEITSLSREHTPILPDLVGGEARARGSVDQTPIILEANSHAKQTSKTDRDASDRHSLRSRSSTDSLGPRTPDSAFDNSDRRYVWQPAKDSRPVATNEPSGLMFEKRRPERNKTQVPEIARQKEAPVLQNIPSRSAKEDLPFLNTSRVGSPYAYSANSGKSTFSGDYQMSPNPMSPDLRQPFNPRDARYRPSRWSHEATFAGGDHRPTLNSPSHAKERPNVTRAASATPFSGVPVGSSPGRKFSKTPEIANSLRPNRYKQYYSSSDESDTSPDESSTREYARPSARSSLNRPEQPRQSSALRYDEAAHRSSNTHGQTRQPVSPRTRPSKASWERLAPDEPRIYGSSAPVAAPFSPRLGIQRPSKASPYSSPQHTPPPSPRLDTKLYSKEKPSCPQPTSRPSSPISITPRPSLRTMRPNSRPSSPVNYPPPSSRSSIELPKERTGDKSKSNAPRSSQSSPLPSPKSDYSSAQPSTRTGVHTPLSPKHKNTLEIPARPRAREAAASFAYPQSPKRQSPEIRRAHSEVETAWPRSDAQQARKPPEAALMSPTKSSVKQVPLSPRQPISLPACSRHAFSATFNDWSTIPESPFFDVCPTCRKGIEDAGYKGQFQPSPQRPRGYETRCDLSLVWVRMAWMLKLRKKAPSPNLASEIMDVVANEPACPGKIGAVRNWYRVYDPETNRLVSNFDICPFCTRSLEVIFPNLRGVFQPAHFSNPNQKRVCDLRSDSHRFPRYVDLLEDISKQAAHYRRPPNMLRFVQLASTMANIDQCSRDDMVLDRPWHFMPHLPEFTVCEECYHDVVWPVISSGSDLADGFNRTLQNLPPSPMGVSCQLYSPRMREVFDEACRRGSFSMLRSSVLRRVQVERELQSRLTQVTAIPEPLRAAELARLVAEWKRYE